MKFAELSIRDFVTRLGEGTPTPGGGSVAALCGALGAALSAMVAKLTVGREKFRDAWKNMEEVKEVADRLAEHFLGLTQEDSDAYQGVIAALRLPKETEQQKVSRQAALQQAMKRASTVPLATLRASEKLIGAAEQAMRYGNPITFTDAAAAVQLAQAAAAIAAYNVLINLSSIEDDAFISECKAEVEDALERVTEVFEQADEYVREQL